MRKRGSGRAGVRKQPEQREKSARLGRRLPTRADPLQIRLHWAPCAFAWARRLGVMHGLAGLLDKAACLPRPAGDTRGLLLAACRLPGRPMLPVQPRACTHPARTLAPFPHPSHSGRPMLPVQPRFGKASEVAPDLRCWPGGGAGRAFRRDRFAHARAMRSPMAARTRAQPITQLVHDISLRVRVRPHKTEPAQMICVPY